MLRTGFSSARWTVSLSSGSGEMTLSGWQMRKQTTAKTEADPYGMTNKRTSNGKDNGKDKGKGNGKGKGKDKGKGKGKGKGNKQGKNKGKSWPGEGIHSHPSRWNCDGWGTRAVRVGGK
jgi:hypothetical protein